MQAELDMKSDMITKLTEKLKEKTHAWKKEREKLQQEIRDLKDDVNNVRDDAATKGYQVTVLKSQSDQLKLENDDLIRQLDVTKEEFKNKLTELLFLTRMKLMKGYVDEELKNWDPECAIKAYYNIYPEKLPAAPEVQTKGGAEDVNPTADVEGNVVSLKEGDDPNSEDNLTHKELRAQVDEGSPNQPGCEEAGNK